MSVVLVALVMIQIPIVAATISTSASGAGIPTPQLFPVAYAGTGGQIDFDPPLGDAHGSGNVTVAYGEVFGCAPSDCEPFEIPTIHGTYEGDCEYAFLELPNTAEGAGHLWGGSVLQATGIKVIVPSHVIVLSALSIAVPDEFCNEATAAIVASSFLANIPD